MKSKLGTWSTGGKSADAGGKPMRQNKVGKVMSEFKSGSLKSSSGQKVKNPKQAMAIALSEASKKGNEMKTKKMNVGGATTMTARTMPDKSNKGGAMRGLERAAAMSGRNMPTTGQPIRTMAKGGGIDGCAVKGKTKAKMVKMAKGGKAC
jgi:hypothetical protein